MIAVSALKVGSVVRLESGSIKFSVTHVEAKTGTISILGYGDRVRMIRDRIDHRLLCWPKDRRDPIEHDEVSEGLE